MGSKHTGSASNIVKVIKRATPTQWAAGIAWYDTARSFCAELAQAYNLPVILVAGVVSALSQNASWGNNKAMTIKLLGFYAAGRRDWQNWHIGMSNPVKKAFDILETGKVDFMTLKCQNFARVINDPADPHSVVIDRWATRAWCDNQAPDYQVKDTLYRVIADDYRIAARSLGLLPSQAQAIAWVVIREETLGTKIAAYEY